jgi:hypothetical protein
MVSTNNMPKEISKSEADDLHTAYIDSLDYKKWVSKINNLFDVSYDLTSKVLASRKLRYAEVDIEVERNAGKIAPDELYIPLHVIDTNIRREQASYVQFIAQSPRAVVLENETDDSADMSLLEKDLTKKLRFKGWKKVEFACIDGFQANAYGIQEVVQDLGEAGDLSDEYVQFGDFCFVADTRDLQKCEIIARAYFFTRTQLVDLKTKGGWNSLQLDKIINAEPNDEQTNIYSGTVTINRSLYKIFKIMFRKSGIVQVAWAGPKSADDWLRKPRSLYVGRRKLNDDANKGWVDYQQALKKSQAQPPMGMAAGIFSQPNQPTPTPEQFGITDKDHIQQLEDGLPASDEEYETVFPYFLFPYLISENNTIASLKGRIFLDQDAQNGASSLMSSTLTQARRCSGLYFSKDTQDPNDDFMMQKNIFFKTGALINGKVSQFQLTPPSAQMFTAIQTLISQNQQETSQVNFAESNKQADSRKTAKAIEASENQSQQLSGVQVTLYSEALREKYEYKCGIIKSRVAAGLIEITNPIVKQLYGQDWIVRPAGDVDVVEKQQLLQAMKEAWPVAQQTGCAMLFLSDLLEMQFPNQAPKYIKAMQQQQQQQQSEQAQQQEHVRQTLSQTADGIIHLADHPEYFSDTGQKHAYPAISTAANEFKQAKAQGAKK